tara:strand:- start:692 stop:994 length:303 start_codon:yes stop_codon:yes gene_type:complete
MRGGGGLIANYNIFIDGALWDSVQSKDDVIASLMGYINGDGVVGVVVEYPRNRFIEFLGESDPCYISEDTDEYAGWVVNEKLMRLELLNPEFASEIQNDL